MKTLSLALLLLASSNAHADLNLGCKHPLPESQRLCRQAERSLLSRGYSAQAAKAKVSSCGYMIPSKVRACLRGLIN